MNTQWIYAYFTTLAQNELSNLSVVFSVSEVVLR